MERIDTSTWKEFKIGDLFNVSRPVARSQARILQKTLLYMILRISYIAP